MANQNTHTNKVGFEIPLKHKAGVAGQKTQKITFSNSDKFLIGVKEDGSSLATIEFKESKPFLVLSQDIAGINLGEPNQVLDSGNKLYALSGVEIDGNNNISLTLNSEGNDFSTLQFYANEIVVKKPNSETTKIETETLNFDLPTNLFELAGAETPAVKVKNLPSQFINVMANQKNVETLSLNIKDKNFSIAKVVNSKNTLIYVVNGTKMSQHNLSDFYIYNPEEAKNKGFIGIKTTKRGTTAFGLSGIDKESVDQILNFISTEETKSQLTILSKEAYESQILKAKTLSAQKDKTKASTSTAGIAKTALKQESEQYNDIATYSSEQEESTDYNSGEGIEDDLVIDINDKLKEQDSKRFIFDEEGVPIGETQQTDDDNEGQDGSASVEVEKEKPEEKPEETVAKTEKDNSIITDENTATDKPTAKTEEKAAEPAKKEETKTVDLSDFAKVFGIGLFLFGLFTGFGGILLSILSVGIGSSSVAFSKKMEKTPLPKGKAALDKAIKDGKEKGIIKEANVSAKSTAEAEEATVNHLEKEGVISSELAVAAKEIIKNFQNTMGLIEKVDKFFTTHEEKVYKDLTMLKATYDEAVYKHDYNKQEKYKPKVKKMTEGLEDLTKYLENFKKFKEHYVESLNTLYKNLDRYSFLVGRKEELSKENLQEKRDALTAKLSSLVAEKNKLKETTNLSKEDKDRMQTIENLIVEVGGSGSFLSELDNKLGELKHAKQEIENLEKSIVNTEIIDGLKNSLIGKIKNHFNRFYEKAKELENLDKHFAQINKKDHKLSSQIQNTSAQEL